MRGCLVKMTTIRCATVLAALALLTAGISAGAAKPATPDGAGQSGSTSAADGSDCQPVTRGSPYIPVDSWVYPAVLRLYALGYVDTVYLGLRPWTRVSVSRMLDETEERLEDKGGAETKLRVCTMLLNASCAMTLGTLAKLIRAQSAPSLSIAWRAL